MASDKIWLQGTHTSDWNFVLKTLAEPDPDGHSLVEAGVCFLTGVFVPELELNSSSDESWTTLADDFPDPEVN